MKRLTYCLLLVAALLAVDVTNVFAGTFAPAGSMLTPRFEHRSTLLPNGQALITAGFIAGQGPTTANAELFDPTTGVFTATGAMATARGSHVAELLPNGKVLVAGGWDYLSNTIFASAELYDPATGMFSPTGMMSTPRTSAMSILLPNGKVLIAGGYNFGFLNSAELYDPSSGTFALTGSMPSVGFDGATPTLLPSGKVLIAGGSDQGPDLSSAVIYDPASGTFTSTNNMLAAHTIYAGGLLPNGTVLIAGGAGGVVNDGNPFAQAEIYDPTSGIFSATGNMTTPRYAAASVVLASGDVLVAGGDDRSFTTLASAETYNVNTGTFTATGSLSTARYDPKSTLLANGQVLVTGGIAPGGTVLATAELYTVNYTVTPSAGSNGTINPSAPQSVNSGATASFTVTPNAGYSIASVGGTCGGTLSGSTYTTNAITSNCTVVASFISAADQINNLITYLQNLNLQQGGTTTSLTSKLQNSLSSLGSGNPNSCNLLNAFINQVQAMSGKQLTTSQATSLIASANQIRAAEACP